MTQSNFNLGSESGGNDSDNSTEDPNSTMSDTVILQKYSKLRQTLPRKPKEKDSDVESISSLALTRGGVRSSLQAVRRDHKSNSISNLNTPEAAGSLHLGTAGSRRTVYLVDDNPKIPVIESSSTTPGTPTPTNENQSSDTTSAAVAPSTFLMYNRISTMYGNNSEEPTSLQTNGSADNKSTTSERKKNGSGNGKGKESAVWYEYGCV